MVVEGAVVSVGAASCVVAVKGSVVVVVGGTVVVVVLVVVAAAILAELLAALDDGWLVHAAVINATAVTEHTMLANRRGWDLMSTVPAGPGVRIATPPHPSLSTQRAGIPAESSSMGAVKGR